VAKLLTRADWLVFLIVARGPGHEFRVIGPAFQPEASSVFLPAGPARPRPVVSILALLVMSTDTRVIVSLVDPVSDRR
jgi:hypothetical protein